MLHSWPAKTLLGTVKLARDAANSTSVSTQPSPDRGYRLSPKIIAYAVWPYHRFCLSLREVEDLLVERGVTVCCEAIRLRCLKLGREFARKLWHSRGRLRDIG